MEDTKRRLYGGRFLIAFFLTVLVFLSIFFFTSEIFKNKAIFVKEEQQQLYYDLLLYQLQMELAQDCESFSLNDLSQKVDQFGFYMDLIEKEMGKNNEFVLSEKNRYVALEVQHMLLSIKQKDICNKTNNTILLFFYSNEDFYVDDSEKVGHMLTNIKINNPNLLVYSFDINLNSSLVNFLKEKYYVSIPNTIIVKNKKIVSPKNVDELYELI